MCMYLLVFAIVIGFPLSGFAQFVDKGEYVEVAHGTKLCPNVILEKSKGRLDPENVYWRVTSKVRANGTQTVAAFVLEALYNRKSGETTIKERRYDEGYATLFKEIPGAQRDAPHDQSERRPSGSDGGDLREEKIECSPSTHLVDQSAPCTVHAVWLARSAEVTSSL